MLVGVAILGYILSTLAAILMENKLKELRGMSTVESENNIIICRFIELSSTIQLVNELRLDPQTKDTAVVLIDESLKASNGIKLEAAKLLGWGRNTLARKVKDIN